MRRRRPAPDVDDRLLVEGPLSDLSPCSQTRRYIHGDLRKQREAWYLKRDWPSCMTGDIGTADESSVEL